MSESPLLSKCKGSGTEDVPIPCKYENYAPKGRHQCSKCRYKRSGRNSSQQVEELKELLAKTQLELSLEREAKNTLQTDYNKLASSFAALSTDTLVGEDRRGLLETDAVVDLHSQCVVVDTQRSVKSRPESSVSTLKPPTLPCPICGKRRYKGRGAYPRDPCPFPKPCTRTEQTPT